MYAPTRRLALAVALVAPVWLLSGSRSGVVVAVAASLLLLVGVLVDVLRAPVRASVVVERSVPLTVGLGDPVDAQYRLRSRWPHPLTVTVHDLPPAAIVRDTLRDTPRDGQSLRLEPHGDGAVPFTFTARERGRHALGPVALRARGALGLVDRLLRYEPGDAITVAPSVAGVRRYRLLAVQHRLRDLGVRQLRRRGGGTSFASLREYATGDDPRHIDWKASARRGKTIVREFTVEQGQTVMIAIDAGRLMTQLAGDHPRFEYALSAAMVLADVAVHSGDHVGLLLFDDEVRAFVPPARGRPALERLREALVPAAATMAEPDYAAAFATLATRHRKRSLVVLFTDVVDARASQSLIAHTTRGAVRHLPLVVALRNDALASAARPAAGAPAGALFESAAAEELLLARDEALQRMRQAGVSVVDVSPRALAAAVVNRYLELKGRGAV